MSALNHYPVGWECACGWQPDFVSPMKVGLQLQTHLVANGWTVMR